MFSLRRALSVNELLREKQKDYRNVVIMQIVIVVSGLLMSEFLSKESNPQVRKLVISIFSGFGAVYSFLLWDMLRNFTNQQWLIKLILIVLSAIVITGILGEFPYYQIIEINNRPLYLFILHGALFPIEVTIIGFAIRDIFSGKVLSPDKLWGAACIYLMIGISFGSLYDLISILNPSSLGVKLELGMPSYTENIYYSFNILGGLDTAYPNPIRLVRNIGVIEAVWGNLFVILIIGKLLTMPRKSKKKGKKDQNSLK